MKISDIKLFSVSGKIKAEWSGEERSSRPMDIYPEYNDQDVKIQEDPEKLLPLNAAYVEVQTDEGLTGIYGPLVYPEQSFIIKNMLQPFLIGKDPLEIEKLWDQMHYIDRHARSGMIMMAISAIDCALWDLRGKYYNVPVYKLLGGPTRSSIRAYASCLGYSLEPQAAAKQALEFHSRGFTAQKWFFRYGPASGTSGANKNIALAEALRNALGNETELMFDCWMGWDTQYAIAMLKQLEKFNPKWLEEPLAPYELEGYKTISRESSVPIAAGEHLYTRWEFKPYLDNGVLRYIQPDPDWTGGITELRKIGHMAELYGVQMLPHGCTVVAAAHVIASLSPKVCPYLEYLVRYQERQQHFHLKPLRPVNGLVELPEMPGLGIELDETKFEGKWDTLMPGTPN